MKLKQKKSYIRIITCKENIFNIFIKFNIFSYRKL